ncbi:MAG: cupin domain-containing protein [Pseudomonadota bacterium]
MSELTVFSDDDGTNPTLQSSKHAAIASTLASVGVTFERWEASEAVSASNSHDAILTAYRQDIDRLIAANGYQTVDVVALTEDHPDKAEMRQKFLAEHTHSEDEVRFFVDGQGLFTLHIDSNVYEVLCEKGDLISVPANTPHWFDMGPNPRFVAIRLFNNPEGWVAKFTGSDIANRFSRLEN